MLTCSLSSTSSHVSEFKFPKVVYKGTSIAPHRIRRRVSLRDLLEVERVRHDVGTTLMKDPQISEEAMKARRLYASFYDAVKTIPVVSEASFQDKHNNSVAVTFKQSDLTCVCSCALKDLLSL